MSKIIGVTGIMGSGKTTLCKKLISDDQDIAYINVDNYRLDLRNNNLEFQQELINNIEALTHLEDINEFIYSNPKNMSIYKNALYTHLEEYINSRAESIIIVDWALIIDDNLTSLFDKIILVTCSNEEIYKRLADSYWPLSEVKHRVSLQLNIEEKQKRLDELNKSYLTINTEELINYDQIRKFIEE